MCIRDRLKIPQWSLPLTQKQTHSSESAIVPEDLISRIAYQILPAGSVYNHGNGSTQSNEDMQPRLSEDTQNKTVLHGFPGVTFSPYCARQRVDSSGGTISGEGIKLLIPDKAIMDGHSIEITIQGCIDGPFELPDGITLASPVYRVAPHYNFLRKVTILMEYFIYLQSDQDCKDLVLLTSTRKSSVESHLRFQVTEADLHWLPQSQYVQVFVTHFCMIALGTGKRGEIKFEYMHCV